MIILCVALLAIKQADSKTKTADDNKQRTKEVSNSWDGQLG